MAEWEKVEISLHARHAWRPRPGCKIFVAGRGAVRFDYPGEWVVIPDEDSIKLLDQEPPDDESRLAVSYLNLQPIDWSTLALSTLVEAAIGEDERPIHTRGPVFETRRKDLEIVWREMSFVDRVEKREAKSRMCIARRSNVQCLITFDFWASDLHRCDAAWKTVLETLELANHIADPTLGPVVS